MNIRNRSISLAGAIAIALATGPVFAADDSTAVSDARLESRITTTYALSPYLRAHDLKVSVVDGEVTLTGTVEEDVNKDLAEQIAHGVAGVTDVDNQINVKADYRPMARTGERPYGATVDDASTSAAVRSKMSWSERSGKHAAKVSTVDGIVTLQGNAGSEEDKAYLTRLAQNTPGVRGVSNKMLVVEAHEPDSVTETIGEAIADGWITTKVKSTFMYSSNINSSDISVSTLGGVVTLTGSVASGPEHALAVELAQNVRGVKRVESDALQFVTIGEVSRAPSSL